jgi:hypothetical protein
VVEVDSDEYRQRMASFNERTCLCGHAFGNHSIFSGCLLCACGCAHDTPRTVEYTDLTSVSGPPTVTPDL